MEKKFKAGLIVGKFVMVTSSIWKKKLKSNIIKKGVAELKYDYHVIMDNKFSNIKSLIINKLNEKI